MDAEKVEYCIHIVKEILSLHKVPCEVKVFEVQTTIWVIVDNNYLIVNREWLTELCAGIQKDLNGFTIGIIA